MTLRAFLALSLAVSCGPALAAPAAVQPTATRVQPIARPASALPMVFYVARGASDACGPACDSWIEAEGQVDSGAAPRFRKFLQRFRDRRPPIYFSSPGGNLDQALAMGGMLRERPSIARVARTVVRECGFEAQDSDVCVKLKQSGRELHGDLVTRGAMCNSACPYLMLGAATRGVAPDTVLGVHSPKVIVHFRGGIPSQQMRAAATARGMDRADHMLTGYVIKMGASTGLLDLAGTIRFENMHVLTRDEIARFGIDPRERVETPWAFETSVRSLVRKTAVWRNEGDRSWRLSQWRLFCLNTERPSLPVRICGARFRRAGADDGHTDEAPAGCGFGLGCSFPPESSTRLLPHALVSARGRSIGRMPHFRTYLTAHGGGGITRQRRRSPCLA